MSAHLGTQDHAAEILRARAKALARRGPQTADPGGTIEVIEFGLAGERYAIETSHVREVRVLDGLTPLPHAPACVAGIVNARGHLLAVLDIRRFFGLPEAGITDVHFVLVAAIPGIEAGILADTVASVRRIPSDEIQPPLPTLSPIQKSYLLGIATDRLVLLDLPRILGDPQLTAENGT